MNAREIFRQKKSQLQESQDKLAAKKAFVAAKQRHRTALPQATLGEDFDPETTASMMLRLNLSRGDTLEEKQNRIRREFPEGDIGVIEDPGYGAGQGVFQQGGQPILVYRESPSDKWKRVDPEGFEAGDVVEAVGPSAEAIIGESAMALRSRGLSVPVTVGRQVLGAVLGEGFEQAGQYALGKQEQSPMEVGGEIAREGAASAIGGFAASPLVAGKNIATGRGALRVGDEGLDIIQAANRLDPEIGARLTPGMVTDNPALRLSERQSAALLPGLQRRYRDLITRVDTAVKASTDAKAGVIQNTSASLKRLQDQFLQRVRGQKVTASEGGKALQEGIEQFNQAQREMVGKAYDVARSIEDPVFDLTPLKNAMQDLQAGAKGTTDPKVQSVINDLKATIKRIEGEKISVESPILSPQRGGESTQFGAFGREAREEIVGQGRLRLSEGRELSYVDDLRNSRSALYDLKTPDPGRPMGQPQGQANDLYKAISTVLDNPQNTNPAFKKSWNAANEMNRSWREFSDKAAVIKAARSENPSDLLSFAKPGQKDNLQTLKSVVPEQKWKRFQSAFYTDLLRDPASISKRLQQFDDETLDVLMTPGERESWQKIGQEMDRINKVGIEKIAERQVTNRNFIDRLVNSADPRDAQTLMRAANETNDKAMKDSLRSSLVEWAWDGIVMPGKGGLAFNQKLLADRVAKLKESGLWRILTRDEKQILGDAEIVGRAFKDMVDAGTSIRAAEAVAGVQAMKASALMTFVRAGMVGQFYTSPLGRKMLLGSGLPNSNGPILRLLAGALAQTSIPEDISQLAKEQEERKEN